MSQKKNFIKTTDVDTATKLEIAGFKLVSHIGNMYTFFNDKSQCMIFEGIDTNKISEGLNGMKKILNILQEVTSTEEATSFTRRSQKPYKRDDD